MAGIKTPYTTRRARWAPAGLGLAVLAGLAAGCAPKYDDLKSFTQGHEQQAAAIEYRIEPPDVINLSSPTAPELDGDIQQIRSDGKISLKLLGEVEAANLTPRELGSKLEEMLSRYYVAPSVTVRVVSFESKKVYVFGQVSRSGALPFTGNDTLLDVLAAAQLTPTAWGQQVKVIRPSASEKDRHDIIVDVDRIVQSGDLKSNFLLQEGDIVYVPPTPLAWLHGQIQDVAGPMAGASTIYTTPATMIGATDYYKNHKSSQTRVWLSPGSIGQ
jgi:protein involved in polysaccharide export with SLBB domain